MTSIFFRSVYNKTIIRFGFRGLWLRLITPTSTLIILDITKTSSSNCLLPKARGKDGLTASEQSSFWIVHLQGVLGELHLLPGARCV